MEFPRLDFSAITKPAAAKAPTGKLPAHPPAAAPAAPVQPVAKPTPEAHGLFGAHNPWEQAHVAKLDEKTQAVVEQLKLHGDWDQGSPSLGENVEAFLAQGGSPKLAAAVLDHCRHPRHIHQVGGKNTCAAAAAQELLAAHDPAKYFQMATELMTTGHTRIDPGNHGFVVSDENRAYIAEQHFDPGTKINAMMQAAMVEYANGFVKYGGDRYHMQSDTSYRDGEDKHKGVSYTQFNNLTNALVGEKVFADQYHSMNFSWSGFHFGLGGMVDVAHRAGFVAGLGQSLDQMMQRSPDGFLMTIHGQHRPHAVMVTGYDAETGKVTYHDPRNTDNHDVECSLDALADRITKPNKGVGVGDVGTAATTGGGTRGGGRTPTASTPPPTTGS